MTRMVMDMETYGLVDLDEVKFNDEMQTISTHKHGQDGFPYSSIELVKDKKEYFKRKLKGE